MPAAPVGNSGKPLRWQCCGVQLLSKLQERNFPLSSHTHTHIHPEKKAKRGKKYFLSHGLRFHKRAKWEVNYELDTIIIVRTLSFIRQIGKAKKREAWTCSTSLALLLHPQLKQSAPQGAGIEWVLLLSHLFLSLSGAGRPGPAPSIPVFGWGCFGLVMLKGFQDPVWLM